ncbi:ABC transporter permease [Lysinibacter cavernae]|uniref:ABC transporter permease n=1 Tax=Lysinibacter cavernae TaxID=1640652 RepID=A0A7X5R111_9MICO|nr:ABC transporter permease [Lysinibacter cavernae]NIH53405.1 hypothetical protein [Lysinibacter cavernae]
METPASGGTAAPQPTAAHPTSTAHWARPLAIAAGAAVIVFVVLVAFLWPTVTTTVHHLPVAITGPAPMVNAVTEALDSNSDDGPALDLVTATDRDNAESLIRSRGVYGAIVLGESPEVLTSSAASPVASQLLGQVAATLQAQLTSTYEQQLEAAGGSPQTAPLNPPAAPRVTVTDVVPLAETDARGAGLAAAAFPIALGGMIGGILISLTTTGRRRRLGALAAYGILGGLAIGLTMQTWFGILQGNLAINMLAISLSLFATGSLIAGLQGLLGRAGLAIAGIVTILLGNPLAANTAPMQFLAEPWGAVGQALVPGASSTLLRTLSYFPEASTATQWITLACWAVGGTLLVIIGSKRKPQPVAEPA